MTALDTAIFAHNQADRIDMLISDLGQQDIFACENIAPRVEVLDLPRKIRRKVFSAAEPHSSPTSPAADDGWLKKILGEELPQPAYTHVLTDFMTKRWRRDHHSDKTGLRNAAIFAAGLTNA